MSWQKCTGIPGESTCLLNWNLYICSLKYNFKSLGVWLCIVSTVGAYIDTCSHLRPHTCQRQTWCWWPAGGRAETVLGKPGCGTAGEGYVEWSSALQLTRTQQWYSTPHIQPETHERTVQWSYTKNNSTFSSRVQHTRQQAPRRKLHVTMSTRQNLLTRAGRPFEIISQPNPPEAAVDPHGDISCIQHWPDFHVLLHMVQIQTISRLEVAWDRGHILSYCSGYIYI